MVNNAEELLSAAARDGRDRNEAAQVVLSQSIPLQGLKDRKVKRRCTRVARVGARGNMPAGEARPTAVLRYYGNLLNGARGKHWGLWNQRKRSRASFR
jgi:hypothetical protein